MMYLDALNDRQSEAVTTTEGPVRVIAGAGTGKTRALTARFCYLTDMLGIDPGAILCVTFTNKAAAEMKERIRAMLGDFDLGYICTFHSFCVRLLKEDIHVLNYPSNFIVIDEDDRTALLQKVYLDMGLTLKELPISRAVDYISTRKAAPGDEYLRYIEELNNTGLLGRSERNADRFDEIFQRYIYEQKKNFAVDFDDIIIFAAYILRKYPDILLKWQQRLEYVMVDEFQDVSPRQYEIARMLAGGHGNLFIVGDPDQTIYSWRGADVGLFLNFHRVYPAATTIVMDANYRSTPQIIAASNALIEHNTNRYPKALHAVGTDGDKPLVNHARTEKAEAAWIASVIEGLVESGGQLSDIAILYRAHHLSRVLEETLLKKGIIYRIYSGTAFYRRREVKDVICYLRMLVSADDIAFERTFNVPPRGFGKKKTAFLHAEAERTGATLMETLRANVDHPVLRGSKARQYIATIDEAAALVGRLPLGDLLQRVLDLSGYEEMLRGLSEWERLDNLAELKRAIEEAGHDDDATLEEFLARVALMTGMDAETADLPAVKLMTVHTAKGMEFPYVFICSLNEASFPSRRCSGPEEIEEERRLAYVAMTRAQRGLFLSDSEGFNHDNTGKTPSRFLYEAGIDNLRFERPLPPQTPLVAPPPSGRGAPRLASGDLVEHPVFGRGMVMDVDRAKETYTVQFDRMATPRTLRFAAPLSLIQ